MGAFDLSGDAESSQEPRPNTPPPVDYTGWRPGLDFGDVLNGLDIGGRGGRTLVHGLLSGQGLDSFSNAGAAVMDSERAASAQNIRNDLGIPTFGTEGDGFFRGSWNPADWDYGDVADAGIDIGINVPTDPFSYVTFGATAAGTKALKAGQELVQSGLASTKVLSPELRSAALKRFAQQTGRVLPEGFTPGPNWKGVGETFGERLAQGDVGLGLQIPFMPSTRREITAPKSLQVAAGAIADPISTGVEALATTGLGKQIGKGVEWAKNTLLNPEVRTAFGLAARNAENVKRTAVDDLTASLDTVDIRLADAGVPVEKWNLAHKLTELTDFDADKTGAAALKGKADIDADLRAVEEYAGVVPTKNAREAAGEKTLQQRYADTVAEVNALDPKQRSAIYDASETFHRMNLKMRDKAAELGIPFAEMGKEVDNKIADRRRALTRLEQQIDDAIQAHTIKNRPPETDPNAPASGTPDAPSGSGGVNDVRAVEENQGAPRAGDSGEGVSTPGRRDKDLGGADPRDSKGVADGIPIPTRPDVSAVEVPNGRGEVPPPVEDVRRPSPVVPSKATDVRGLDAAGPKPAKQSRTAAATEAAAAKRDAERTSTPVLDKIQKMPPERQAEIMIRADKVANGKKIDLEGLNEAEKKLLGQVREARKNLKRMGADIGSLESADEVLDTYNRMRREADNLGGRMASLDQMQDDGVNFQPDMSQLVRTSENGRVTWDSIVKNSRESLPTTLTKTEVGILAIADGLGMQVKFYDNLPARGVFSRGKGMIGLQRGMKDAELAHTFGHEFTHQAFSRLGRDGAEDMLAAARGILGREYDGLMADITSRYGKQGIELTPQKALEEILVDAGGKLFKDDGMQWIAEAAKVNPGILDHFIGILKNMYERVSSIIASVPKAEREGLEGLARHLQDMEVRALQMRKGAARGADDVRFMANAEDAADSYAIPKNELPEDIQAMMKERDAVRNEVQRLEQLKRETPSYAPHVLNSKLEVTRAPGTSGPGQMSKGVLSKQRGIGFNNGEVPATLEEAEKEYSRMGGSRATLGGTQKEDARMTAALKGVTTKEGLADLKANLKDLTLFEQNPVLAYAKRIESFGSQMSNATMQRNLTNTFRAIPTETWNELIDEARKGTGEKELKNLFTAATGSKIEDVMPEGVTLTEWLKSDKGLTASPKNYVEVPNAADGSAMWLPAGVADRYKRYLDTQKRGPEVLGAIGGLLQGFTKYWKLAQTSLWPSFHVRNTVGDTFRMIQEDAFDGQTGGEILNMTTALIGAGKKGIDGIDPNAVIDLGKGGGVVPLQSFLKQVQGEGLWNTGQLSEQMTGRIDEIINKHTGKDWKNIPSSLKKANNLLAQRENVMKAAAVATRMRAGDTFLEATLRAQDALFDYSQVSPAVDFLRKTGVAPFAAWFAKNIPAQLEWSIRNPGKLAALARGYQKMSSGEISEDALPEYMQDRHNIVVETSKDAKGNTVWQIKTTEGLIPVDDILNLTANPEKSMKGLMGPLWKASLELAQPDKPGREGTWFGDTADALLGKPLQTLKDVGNIGAIDPRTGEASGAGDVLNNLFNPMRSKAIKVEESIKKAEQRSKSQLGTYAGKLKQATAMLNDATAAAEMDGNGENGIQIPYWGDELRRLRNAVSLAQQEYQREQARHEAESKANARMLRRAAELSRAP